MGTCIQETRTSIQWTKGNLEVHIINSTSIIFIWKLKLLQTKGYACLCVSAIFPNQFSVSVQIFMMTKLPPSQSPPSIFTQKNVQASVKVKTKRLSVPQGTVRRGRPLIEPFIQFPVALLVLALLSWLDPSAEGNFPASPHALQSTDLHQLGLLGIGHLEEQRVYNRNWGILIPYKK